MLAICTRFEFERLKINKHIFFLNLFLLGVVLIEFNNDNYHNKNNNYPTCNIEISFARKISISLFEKVLHTFLCLFLL